MGGSEVTHSDYLGFCADDLQERAVVSIDVCERLRVIAAELRAAQAALAAADNLAEVAKQFASDMELNRVLATYRAAAETYRESKET